MTITLQPEALPGHHIIGLESEHLNGGIVPWHKHIYAQLLYPAEGAVRVWAGGSVWMVHASCALWLPPQMPHKFVATGNVLLKTILINEAQSKIVGNRCFTTGISPLLRELLIAINQLTHQQQNSPDSEQQQRFSALETLILQEIKAGGKVSLELPWPRDMRLQSLCEELMNHPGYLPSLDNLADKISVSSRTLMRLFVKETGLTFRHWIQQMHVISAISLLEEGSSVAKIAHHLGYASAESFGNMFKRRTGYSPSKYSASIK
ncbi:helix-turn-helix transcriptional regulator [Kluyvera cryocrescens]|uniref:AraC family transcriptional regulator n=1 Tax=Kluyvera cryocrescens TaxID=580 RepID=UPI0028BDB4C5|nr:helix-turn-helix transcriptional regulator [Kluyvera cryocrescens]WNN69788.1 helix-turn-helix transcriptional regulator [Kluyvera cryocrescens]HEP1894599.1 helix-turn-helix transcriptional regulator [Kluyvera cryocrescens]